jgi:hypothetical protein
MSAPARRPLARELRGGIKTAAREYGVMTAAWRPGPDFLVIGTKRGGTTTLWNGLVSHQRVLRMWPGPQKLKSSHYFTMRYERGPEFYRSYFPLALTRRYATRRRGPALAGEASPLYLYDPRVPQRVAVELPHTRIIVLLRNPVDRAYSHYQERRHEGVESLSFDEALRAEPARMRGELERMAREPFYYSEPFDWYSYRDRGDYAPQLARWREVVEPERLLVLRSEDLYRDPRRTFAQVLGFLGLDGVPASIRHHNLIPRSGMAPDLRHALAEYYRPRVEQLEALVGRSFHWDLEGGGVHD